MNTMTVTRPRPIQMRPGLTRAVIVLVTGLVLSGSRICPAQTAQQHFENGSRSFQRRDYASAEVEFDKAVRALPAAAAPYCGRGAARLKLKRYSEAMADLNRCLEIDPNLINAYCWRSNVHTENGNHKEAIADCDRAIGLDPNHPDPYMFRSRARYHLLDYHFALADATRSIELNDSNGPAHMFRGMAKIKMTPDWIAGVEDFSAAIHRDPLNPEPYNWRGIYYYNTRNWEKSTKDFLSMIEMSKVDAEADTSYQRFYLWLIQARTGDEKAASAALEKYFVEEWKRTNEHWHVAIASFLLGYSDATKLLARAQDKDEKTMSGQKTEAYFYIGMKSLLADDKASAVKYLQQCVDMNNLEYMETASAVAELKALQLKTQ